MKSSCCTLHGIVYQAGTIIPTARFGPSYKIINQLDNSTIAPDNNGFCKLEGGGIYTTELILNLNNGKNNNIPNSKHQRKSSASDVSNWFSNKFISAVSKSNLNIISIDNSIAEIAQTQSSTMNLLSSADPDSSMNSVSSAVSAKPNPRHNSVSLKPRPPVVSQNGLERTSISSVNSSNSMVDDSQFMKTTSNPYISQKVSRKQSVDQSALNTTDSSEESILQSVHDRSSSEDAISIISVGRRLSGNMTHFQRLQPLNRPLSLLEEQDSFTSPSQTTNSTPNLFNSDPTQTIEKIVTVPPPTSTQRRPFRLSPSPLGSVLDDSCLSSPTLSTFSTMTTSVLDAGGKFRRDSNVIVNLSNSSVTLPKPGGAEFVRNVIINDSEGSESSSSDFNEIIAGVNNPSRKNRVKDKPLSLAEMLNSEPQPTWNSKTELKSEIVKSKRSVSVRRRASSSGIKIGNIKCSLAVGGAPTASPANLASSVPVELFMNKTEISGVSVEIGEVYVRCFVSITGDAVTVFNYEEQMMIKAMHLSSSAVTNSTPKIQKKKLANFKLGNCAVIENEFKLGSSNYVNFDFELFTDDEKNNRLKFRCPSEDIMIKAISAINTANSNSQVIKNLISPPEISPTYELYRSEMKSIVDNIEIKTLESIFNSNIDKRFKEYSNQFQPENPPPEQPQKAEFKQSILDDPTTSPINLNFRTEFPEQSNGLKESSGFWIKHQSIDNLSGTVIIRYDLAEDGSASGKYSISAATLDKLVERLSDENPPDDEYIFTFLNTFRYYSNTNDILELILGRLDVVSNEEANFEEMEFVKTWRLMIKVRVISFFEKWIKYFWNVDFAQASNTTKSFVIKFVDNITRTEMINDSHSELIFLQKGLKHLILTLEQEFQDSTQKALIRQSIVQGNALSQNTSTKSKFEITDLESLDVAEQLTLVEFIRFQKIRPTELFLFLWRGNRSDETYKRETENLTKFIEGFNEISYWVATTICTQPELKKRVKVMEKFIRISKHCWNLGNFSSSMAIFSGLNVSAVNRLKQTWESVNPKTMKQFQEVEISFQPQMNYKNYRAQIESLHSTTEQCNHTPISSANQPMSSCIPVVSIFLKDLTFMNDGNPKYIETSSIKLINYGKLRTMYKTVLNKFLVFKNSSFSIEKKVEIYEFCSNLKTLKTENLEARLYKYSLLNEPKAGETSLARKWMDEKK